ncbi:MAG: hypothetical protein GY832_30855 [Chloroflexi bacterium]|nr:hypothetical protein [Chloroflexota bacterium]
MNHTKYEKIWALIKNTRLSGRIKRTDRKFELWKMREEAGEPIIGFGAAFEMALAGVWSDPEDWSAGMVEKHGKLIPLLTLVYQPCEWVDKQMAKQEAESDTALLGKLAILEGAWT